MKTTFDIKTMREVFGEILCRKAYEYQNLYALSADTENSMGLSLMRKNFADRVINVGICEQNMAGVASGIAASGGKVVMATYAPFASMRMLEQVRTYIACLNLDVKVIAGMGGLSGSREGVSHHGVEDISIMRSIPNMTVIIAADACATAEITEKIIDYEGPVYFRLGRNVVPKIFDKYMFQIGKANIIKAEGNDASIICNGSIIQRVLKAERFLFAYGLNVQIIEMPCVKPIDRDTIIAAAKETGKIVTIEENNVLGGLGGAVAEVLSEMQPVPLLRIGIVDTFTKAGSYDELLDLYGFEPHMICEKIIQFLMNWKI